MSERMRRIFRIVAVTAAVYLAFAWLLPLLMPFLLAWVTALVLRPSALWLSEKLSFSLKGRRFRLSPGLLGGVELLFFSAVICGLLVWGIQGVGRQASLLAERFPEWLLEADYVLTGFCHRLEADLSLRSGAAVEVAQDLLRQLGNTVRQGLMPYLMGNSMAVLGCCIAVCVILVIYLIAAALFIEEMELWKNRIQKSPYWPELERVGNVLGEVGNAYLRTQGIIMLLTMAACSTVFFFLGESYYLLEGIAIGLLDALPVFGTGALLIPWSLLLFLKRQWGRGTVLLILYGVCYVIRQLLEAKMMGNRVGMTALETLAAVYVGLQLFGILGVLLGPVGLQLIKEFASPCNPPANPV